MAGLLVLTLAPLPQAANRLASARGFDKAVHFLLLGCLAALLYWNKRHASPDRGPTLLSVVGPSAALAALIELLQAPLPYRTADFWDFFWGAAGALAAYLIARWLAGLGAERWEN